MRIDVYTRIDLQENLLNRCSHIIDAKIIILHASGIGEERSERYQT